jgi:serine/threonine protein kinase, bacterial
MFKKYFYLLTGLVLFLGCAFLGTEALAKSVSATKTEISLVDGIAVDKKGNTYIAMRDNNIISRIDLQGNMTTYVGTGSSGFSGDGGKATEARLNVPAGLAFDKRGNLYIADRSNNRIRKVDTRGTITTIAGTGTAGFSGDGGPATQAQLNLPSGIALDGKGNIFISDRSNNRIRVIDSSGKIRTYAGSGNDGFRGDNGPALRASIDRPFGIALDRKGNLYIADRRNSAVDSQGMISTVVGTGQQDYNGDSEVARDTNLHLPFGVALNPDGTLLVIDRSHYRIRSIDLKRGSVKTIAGNGSKMFAGDGGPATGATLSFPHGIAVDKKDNVLISDKGNYRIRKITPDNIIHTIAGNGIRGNIGDDMPAMEASIYGATSLKLNNKEEMFILSPSGFVSLIRKIDEKGIMRKFLETVNPKYLKSIANSKYKGKVQTGELAIITTFSDIAFDHKGNMFISDRLNHQIRKVDSKGNISTIAGTGESSHYGDGGPASEAAFRDPSALATDKEGNLYIGDSANNMVRKIDTNGIISTIAGNGNHKATGDGGPAVKAGIRNIDYLAVSPQGEVHIVGMNSNSVRKITKDGKIVTVAGTGYQGYFGDGGPATKAMLKSPVAIAFDSKGNLYITDMGNNRIRKVDTKGIISTFAGTGNFGWAQDGETVEIILHHFP